MLTVTCQPEIVPPNTITARPARLYVDGQRRRDLFVNHWVETLAPGFATAQIISRDEQRLAVGQCVEIASPVGMGPARWCGVVTSTRDELDKSGLLQRAEVEHELAVSLRETPVPEALSAGVSVAAALDSLLALLPDVWWTPSRSELNRQAGHVNLDAFSVTGKTLSNVLPRVAEQAGLLIRAARDARGICFFHPGVQGPRTSLRMQDAGKPLDLGLTNIHEAEITQSRDASHASHPVRPEGEIRLGGLDFSCRVGSCPVGIPGRSLDWTLRDQTQPWVSRVRHDFETWQTVLDLEDAS